MRRWLAVALALAGVAQASGPSAAQEVKYVTVSKTELSGIMGTMASLFTGSNERSETTYQKGSRVRMDSESSSSIVDLASGLVVSLNHDDQTYMEMSFADIGQLTAMMTENARTSAGAVAAADQGMELQVSFDVDRTSERRTISGASAQRIFMTMTTDMDYTAPEAEGGEQAPFGKIVLLTDMWLSTETPIWEAMQNMDHTELQGLRESATEMTAMLQMSPGLQDAMTRAAEEADKMEGIPLLSTTMMFMVPDGVEFDREQALNAPDGPSAGDVAKDAAGDAARGAVRNLTGGLFGRRRQEEPVEQAPGPMKLMTSVSEITEVEESVDDSVFEIPSGYRKIELADMMSGRGGGR